MRRKRRELRIRNGQLFWRGKRIDEIEWGMRLVENRSEKIEGYTNELKRDLFFILQAAVLFPPENKDLMEHVIDLMGKFENKHDLYEPGYKEFKEFLDRWVGDE